MLREEGPCLNLFFPSWTLDTRTKFLLAMVGIVLLAIFTEFLSLLRFQAQHSIRGSQTRRWTITLLHGLQALFGYVLMLATMTFSVELFLCVIGGLGLGYALFYNENDPHVTTNPCCNFIQSEAIERTSIRVREEHEEAERRRSELLDDELEEQVNRDYNDNDGDDNIDEVPARHEQGFGKIENGNDLRDDTNVGRFA